MISVWVFKGQINPFPSAVFSAKELAFEWISKHKLSGTLTEYHLDQPVIDWAVEKGYFKPKAEANASQIANFSSASQEHFHFEDGEMQ